MAGGSPAVFSGFWQSLTIPNNAKVHLTGTVVLGSTSALVGPITIGFRAADYNGITSTNAAVLGSYTVTANLPANTQQAFSLSAVFDWTRTTTSHRIGPCLGNTSGTNLDFNGRVQMSIRVFPAS